MSAVFKNWQPTVGGLILALGIIFTELSLAFDNDDKTSPNFNRVIAAIVAAGGATMMGATSRQWNVTSEESVGTKQVQEKKAEVKSVERAAAVMEIHEKNHVE